MNKHVSASVNGTAMDGRVDARSSLGDFLRDDCGLTGTHLGCEHGVCGACTVTVDDAPVRSCILYAVQADGRAVRTIEGFEGDDVMDRLRNAFSVHHALQCGFCAAGMLITARDIVLRLGPVGEDRVREELSGNICRCTGYVGIVKAIQDVAAQIGPPTKRSTQMPVHASHAATLVALAGPEAPVAEAKARSTFATSAPKRGDEFSVSRSVTISHPVEAVWSEFADPFAVAACLPGAVLTERDGDLLRGRVRISMGPIKAQFAGEATYFINGDDRSGSVSGEGKDSLSNSRANGELRFSLSPAAEEMTLVEVELKFTLQGMLAQFSRPAIVNDFSSFLIEQFADNLTRRLAGQEPVAQSEKGDLTAGSLLRWKLGRFWSRIVQSVRR